MEKETPKEVSNLEKVTELLKICNNSEKPDAKAREELQQLIRANPDYREAMKKQLGMYSVALRTRIENFSATGTFKEVLYVKCDQLKEDLGYSTANQLEKLAIEQIVLCWVNHHQTEIQFENYLSRSHGYEAGIYWEKRLAFSSRRYNRALEMLSKMRKMNLVVQVNTTNNQIINN